MIALALMSAVLAYGTTWIVRRLALHWQIVDKKSTSQTPLLGGSAIYLTTIALISFMLPVLGL